MNETIVSVIDIPALGRAEAAALALAENQRFVDLARSLTGDDWSRATDCPAWDVRAMTGHVLGAMEFTSSLREFVHQLRAGKKAAGDRPDIDGMTEVQVRERAHLAQAELIRGLELVAPRAARARRRLPNPLRQISMKVEVGGAPETWRLGFLFDVILTRDTWMHRVDIARATQRDLVLTPEHDGRLVTDVVAEWARRHGRAFTLDLAGPAGGSFSSAGSTHDDHAEHIALDAVEFCRILSGRASGAGLLNQEVPF